MIRFPLIASPYSTNVRRKQDQNLKYLHFVDSAVKFVIRNGIEDLPDRIDVSLINEVATGTCAPFPQAALRGGDLSEFSMSSPMSASPLSFSLLTASGSTVAGHCQCHHLQ